MTSSVPAAHRRTVARCDTSSLSYYAVRGSAPAACT